MTRVVKRTRPLNDYQNNVYSQFGEDGIIEEILARIGGDNTDGWCAECGAWDGMHLSNTYNLIKNKAYKAVLIEGDKKKYRKLCENLSSDNIVKVCEFIHFSGSTTLDAIFKESPIPTNFDFLSIDIDGCDYYIFESLIRFKPKIVCVEFNPTIPNPVEFVQTKDFSIKQGASARSMAELGEKKGYALVASTKCNLLFIDKTYEESVGGGDIDKIRDDSSCRNYIFNGYDGTVLTSKPFKIVWFGITVPHAAMQKIPKFLRTYPDDYNWLQKKFSDCGASTENA